MKYGTKTNRIRSLRGHLFTIEEAMNSGLTYTQAHGIIHKLMLREELRRVRKGDIGRFAKRKSAWKFSA